MLRQTKTLKISHRKKILICDENAIDSLSLSALTMYGKELVALNDIQSIDFKNINTEGYAIFITKLLKSMTDKSHSPFIFLLSNIAPVATKVIFDFLEQVQTQHTQLKLVITQTLPHNLILKLLRCNPRFNRLDLRGLTETDAFSMLTNLKKHKGKSNLDVEIICQCEQPATQKLLVDLNSPKIPAQVKPAYVHCFLFSIPTNVTNQHLHSRIESFNNESAVHLQTLRVQQAEQLALRLKGGRVDTALDFHYDTSLQVLQQVPIAQRFLLINGNSHLLSVTLANQYNELNQTAISYIQELIAFQIENVMRKLARIANDIQAFTMNDAQNIISALESIHPSERYLLEIVEERGLNQLTVIIKRSKFKKCSAIAGAMDKPQTQLETPDMQTVDGSQNFPQFTFMYRSLKQSQWESNAFLCNWLAREYSLRLALQQVKFLLSELNIEVCDSTINTLYVNSKDLSAKNINLDVFSAARVEGLVAQLEKLPVEKYFLVVFIFKTEHVELEKRLAVLNHVAGEYVKTLAIKQFKLLEVERKKICTYSNSRNEMLIDYVIKKLDSVAIDQRFLLQLKLTKKHFHMYYFNLTLKQYMHSMNVNQLLELQLHTSPKQIPVEDIASEIEHTKEINAGLIKELMDGTQLATSRNSLWSVPSASAATSHQELVAKPSHS